MRWVASVSGVLLFWAAWVDAPNTEKAFQLYTNTHSMGSKQEELETCTCLHGCDITGITQSAGVAPVAGALEWKVVGFS